MNFIFCWHREFIFNYIYFTDLKYVLFCDYAEIFDSFFSYSFIPFTKCIVLEI